jgi:hypothetical protein
MNDKVSTVNYSASGLLTLLAAWNIEYIMMGLGLLIAGLTFLMNWFFKYREDKRAIAEELRKYDAHQADQRRKDELHNARMMQLIAPDENHIRPE